MTSSTLLAPSPFFHTRRPSQGARWLGLLTAFLAALVLGACSGGGGGGGSSGGSAPAGNVPPIIIGQPQSVRVSDGQPASLSVTTVSSTAATYQWSRAGVPIAGATASTYTLPSAQLADSGAAFVVAVSNAAGTVQSATATLTVDPVGPSIPNDAPRSLSVVEGQPATLTVTATGSAPLSFQWRRDGTPIPGATASTYTIASAFTADSGVYTAVITNAAGTVTSAPVTLTVQPRAQAPSISAQPQSQAVRLGGPVSFTVGVGGTAPFTFQWLRNGVAIAGAQGPTFTLPATALSDNGARFSVVVSNAAGAATSAEAVLTVTTQESLSLLAGNVGGPGSIDGTGGRARFLRPSGVAYDSAGNVYVADGNEIRKVSASGVVMTFAGSTTAGSADGAGTAASFRAIGGLAIDPAGNLFVADSGNHTIRLVSPAGAVSTVSGVAGSAGAVDGPVAAARFSGPNDVAIDLAGNVYVADTGNQLIRRIGTNGVVTTLAGVPGTTGAADGPAAAALFNLPGGLVVDGQSNVYVADTGNSTIRRISAVGVVSTIAGAAGAPGSVDGSGGAARFNGPTDVSLDAAGNLYVADSIGPTVRRVTPAGAVTTVAGTASVIGSRDGTGPVASFARPFALAATPAGVVYVADRDNFDLRRIEVGGGVSTVAGAPVVQGSADGVGAAATFNVPIGVAVDRAGNVYLSDYFNATIRVVTQAGQSSTIAGLAGTPGFADGPGGAARFTTPQGIAVDAAGNVYVADINAHTIRKVSAAGVVTTLAGTPGVSGSANGPGNVATFTFPNAVAVDGAGNVFVTERANTIRRITPAGVVSTLAGTAGRTGAADGVGAAASFNFPYGIAIDAAGNLFVADSGNATIRKVAQDGTVSTVGGVAGRLGTLDGPVATATFAGPSGIAIDGSGNIFVADVLARTIREITAGGIVRTVAGVPDGSRGVALGALPGHLDTPVQLALDAAGFLYVTDSNGVIRVVLP